MLLYQAPLEGITGYIYRNALKDIFGGVDKYFAPFISPYEKRIITEKERKQLCPEHNTGIKLVPQILTMDSKGFRELTDWLSDNYGYDEFNLNFGCPSGTVVSKGRGAGSLKDLDVLERFLDEIMEDNKYRISIKTRIGMHSVDEFEEILNLYNKYNLTELIIHPRVRDELYNGNPHMDIYKYACENSRNPLIYNGNIDNPKIYDEISSINSYVNQSKDTLNVQTAQETGIMIGRPMIANPAIFREMRGGKAAGKQELLTFLNRLKNGYLEEFGNDVNVLHKLKEVWVYMGPYLDKRIGVDEKVIKKLMKSKRLSEYDIYMKEIIRKLD